ncbi:hypothetical protein TEA_003719 [Camellia sinensis var. sinensis]|uniref:Importin N-terminal domain-containing protein n=1 Tax=Camellia sinensis var. sinensis TaxID=542762 RepID=A0A4S4D0K0_CAMSN|nr:hypothetical protein TEA_003719 [Camellia sinensis var. sinensis]
MESLAQLEALCERLYNSQDSAERASAENTLKCFSVNTDYISQCQYILDNALTPYALMLASSSLLKQVTEQRLPLQLRLDIRNILVCLQIIMAMNVIGNYLTNYLATRGPDLEPFVIGSLIQLFCRVIKFGWFDDDSFREVVKESMNFLNQAKPSLAFSHMKLHLSLGPVALPLPHFNMSPCLGHASLMPGFHGWHGCKVPLHRNLRDIEVFSKFVCMGNATDLLATFHYAIGLKILNQLISEMNQPNPGLPSTHHRRVACSFRDQSLLQIFRISLTSLCQLKNDVGSKLQELALSLSLKCLSFDFVGTSFDESSDDFGSVQIPSSWKPVIEDPSTLQIFFDYYAITKPLLSREALECLVRLASVRRSLFTNDTTRLKYLAHLMTGTKEIMETGKGGHDLAVNFKSHQSKTPCDCKADKMSHLLWLDDLLVARGSCDYEIQLSELVNMEGYSSWISLVTEFTLKSLQSWQWASSSVYYLLGLWSRLVTSVPYLKGNAPNLLNEFVPKIIEHFISSKFDSIQAGLSDDLSEDPLDNVELLQDQLECIPYLCRFQYEICSTYIMQITDPILQMYMEAVNLPALSDNSELLVIEAKLSWIVHIIAAILKTKQFSGVSAESYEIRDAELSARVLRLINVTDSGLHSQRVFESDYCGLLRSEIAVTKGLVLELCSEVYLVGRGKERRYGEVTKQRLDLAVLVFFQHFRKSYVGDQAMHSSKQLYTRLSELLGLHDHLLILNVIVGKIATNLKCYAESEEVINHTLSLFSEMATGYMTGKLLLKLDTIQYIISHHNREHFHFLENYSCSRCRTTFYYTIGLLIFMEDNLLKFKSSMDPLLQVFVSLESMPDAIFRTDAVKYALIGLMRDLRGITMATNSRRTYGFLFDWLYPARMPLLLKAITHWTDTPEVTTPLLKFMAEFVLNKSQRLTFDSSSPNGILLFREVSKLIVAYGSRILSLPNRADMYTFKYKGIWILLSILSRALAGNYVNFGVFELYGDRALSDALDIALKLILSIPLVDILAYRKAFFYTSANDYGLYRIWEKKEKTVKAASYQKEKGKSKEKRQMKFLNGVLPA